MAATNTSREEDYTFLAEEGPTFPGSPYFPPHPRLRRMGYASVGVWIGATSALANATVNVNLSNLSGESSLYVAEASWLPAIYVAFNACANLLLVKSRNQFGVARVMHLLFILYALATAMQFVVPGFASAIVVRAVSGVVAAGMTTLCVYYLLQTLPRKDRPIALVIGLGMTQLGTPLARMLPVDMLSAGGWRGQICIEFGLVCTALALTTLLPLPRSDRIRQIQWLDLVTVALFLPAMVLLCGVLNRGRLAWWTDTPWLGVALCAAVPLFALAIVIESLRDHPLLNLRWIGTASIIRFAVVALLMRLALAEQTYGAVGLLTSSGLDDDQLRILFECVAASMVLGIATAAMTLSEQKIPYQVIAAALFIAAGAWLDTRANNLTRPEQLYLSQSLIGFGTSLFVGPTMAHGILQVIKSGPNYLVSLVVVFSITQNVGGLAGSAALGTYQTIAAREHAAILGERMEIGDPQIAGRVQGSAAALRTVLVDASARTTQGGLSVGGVIAREANFLAFNDVFRLVARLAIAMALFMALDIVISAVTKPKRSLAA